MSNLELNVSPQAYEVYEILKSGRSYSPIEALNELGCFRLAARIHELRREGVEIVTKTEVRIGRGGRKLRFGRYSIKQ